MSPDLSTRILLVGDMHLGRRPTGLPDELGPETFGPAAALQRVVDAAVRHRVQAVAFAGDLVDGANALFEAYGALAAAMRSLLEQGIQVVAVAGNHDTRTLPRLAAELGEGFHLLGAGGTWSSHLVRGGASLPIRIVGWSFPDRHHATSPLDSPPPAPQAAEVTVGLLHADLEDPSSRYAPVTAGALRAVGYSRWFLGHIHRPDPVATDGSPMYLGSLTPLDPSETGIHGPVLAGLDARGKWTASRLPLAPLRWEHRQLPCPDLVDPGEGLAPAILKAMLEWRWAAPGAEQLQALGFRLELTGRVARPMRVTHTIGTWDLPSLSTSADGVRLFVQRLRSRVTGDHDLQQIAKRDDPTALLARTILALQDDPDGELAGRILAQAQVALGDLQAHQDFAHLSAEHKELGRTELGEILVQQAYRILDARIADQEVRRGSS